mmetsp:Transcript_26022/g.75894  ORF Transcript_26022/g.75894 Transcript_26022/m.75894 type:complete len:217 (-) Transcript_26022:1176-1826(-)
MRRVEPTLLGIREVVRDEALVGPLAEAGRVEVLDRVEVGNVHATEVRPGRRVIVLEHVHDEQEEVDPVALLEERNAFGPKGNLHGKVLVRIACPHCGGHDTGPPRVREQSHAQRWNGCGTSSFPMGHAIICRAGVLPRCRLQICRELILEKLGEMRPGKGSCRKRSRFLASCTCPADGANEVGPRRQHGRLVGSRNRRRRRCCILGHPLRNHGARR